MVSQKTKEYLIAGSILALCSVVVVYYVQSTISKKGTELVAAVQTIEDQTLVSAAYSELEELMADSQEDRAAITALQLSESATIDFISSIETLARSQAVEVVTNSLAVEEVEEANLLKVSLSLEGEKERVHAMIALLETLPQVGYLTDVVLRYQTDTNVATTKTTLVIVMKKS